MSRPTSEENRVFKFPDLREEDSGAECADVQFVEVCELLARPQETYYMHYKTVGKF